MRAHPFRAAHGAGEDWGRVARLLTDGLGRGERTGHALGFLYVTEPLAHDFGSVLTFLRETTGVETWVGAVGYGVCAEGAEYFNECAASALIAPFAPSDYRIVPTIRDDVPGAGTPAPRFEEAGVALAVMHGDPANADIPDVIAGFSDDSGAFLVGGLTTVERDAQVADRITGGGLSGVMLSPAIGAVTGLSQGCAPIGPGHAITDGRDNVLVELDRRPALDVFIEDIGPDLAQHLNRAGHMIQVALSVPGSDTGDYLVRNLTGIDPGKGLLAIGDVIDTGQTVTFCTRSRDTAMADLKSMAGALAARLGTPPAAGLYFSCVARGPNLFGPGAREMRLLHEALGPFPLAGFYANGEIFSRRLYGYTGVLVLFP